MNEKSESDMMTVNCLKVAYGARAEIEQLMCLNDLNYYHLKQSPVIQSVGMIGYFHSPPLIRPPWSTTVDERYTIPLSTQKRK